MAGRADPRFVGRAMGRVMSVMPNYDLDEVVKGLQSCVSRARNRVDQRQRKLLEHLVEIGKDGKPASLSWRSRLPSGDGGFRTYELLRMPWASLRSSDEVRIASVAIDVNCRIKASEPADESNELPLTVIPVDTDYSKSAGTHRLRIEIGGDSGEPARVSIDDQLFRGENCEDFAPPQDLVAPVGPGNRWVEVLSGWKSMTLLVLLGLLAAALLWYFKMLPRS